VLPLLLGFFFRLAVRLRELIDDPHQCFCR
jgi:hypothetical protein